MSVGKQGAAGLASGGISGAATAVTSMAGGAVLDELNNSFMRANASVAGSADELEALRATLLSVSEAGKVAAESLKNVNSGGGDKNAPPRNSPISKR